MGKSHPFGNDCQPICLSAVLPRMCKACPIRSYLVAFPWFCFVSFSGSIAQKEKSAGSYRFKSPTPKESIMLMTSADNGNLTSPYTFSV